MKNIVLIGASSGIGLSLAQLLCQENNTYASYHSNAISSSQNLHYFPLNVLDDSYSFDFLPETIDGFVYCPGSILLKPFARVTPHDFESHYQLNVMGAVKTLQAILPRLKKSSNASIILFSTVAVQTGMSFHSVVSSTKGAIEGLTKALASEYAPTIRVNCIAPSLVDTPMAEHLLNTEEKILHMGAKHPMKRIGHAEDIANMASFLLSDKSSWITGQILHVDGGMSSLK